MENNGDRNEVPGAQSSHVTFTLPEARWSVQDIPAVRPTQTSPHLRSWISARQIAQRDFHTRSPIPRLIRKNPIQKTGNGGSLLGLHWTTDAKQRGFQARSVVGGLFIKMLSDPDTWKHWRTR